MINSRKQFLDSDTLKLTADATMLIDHIGAALLLPALFLIGAESYDRWEGVYRILRSIGRTAFPIFAFLLVEGLFHTRDRKRYFGRLFLFALLSEIPFDLAFHGMVFYREDQNVFWTLATGFFVIWGIDELYRRCGAGRIFTGKNKDRSGGCPGGRTGAVYQAVVCILSALLIITGWFAATVLQMDYGGYGILLILLFYFGKHVNVSRLIVCIGGYLLFLWEPYCIGGFLLILFYNGERKPRGKGARYFFYFFYPVHLWILGLIRVAFFPA